MTGTPAPSDAVEKLRQDLKARWQRGQRVLVEWYVARDPALVSNANLMIDFLSAEYRLREELEGPPNWPEYCQRFPQFAQDLQARLQISSPAALEQPAIEHPAIAAAPRGEKTVVGTSSPRGEKTVVGPAAPRNEVTLAGASLHRGENTLGDTPNGETFVEQKTLGADPQATQRVLANHLVAGEMFGRYELIQELGRGGMGVVWKARDVELDRFVAIKLILPGHVESEVGVRRFQVEARSAARLDHPGIVTVHDFGERDGKYYLCMAYVEGISLAARLAKGALPPSEAANMVREIAEAIQHAHERGVVHRDLKPQNILLTKAGSPRVSDFGLARRTDLEEGITASGQVLGTPTYMSPEQAAGKPIGPPTDIYALGAIFYYALAGRPLFEGTNVLEIIRRVSEGRLKPLRAANPAVPPALEAICNKCLAKEPLQRYKSAGELAAALGRAVRPQESSAGGGTVILKPHAETPHDVFLSYSPKDQSIAEQICSSLESADVPCWISSRDVVSGKSWEESSGRAIAESHVVVLILSSHSNNSERVLREIEYATKKGIMIVTMRVADVSPDLLRPFIRAPHRVDALGSLEAHLPRLYQVVSSFVPGALVASAPDEPVRAAGETQDDNGLKMKMVWCPAGKFRMGSPLTEVGRFDNEGPIDVTLTRGFWISRLVATQSQWRKQMNSAPWDGQRWVKIADDCPAVYVSWTDAMEFCRRFTEEEQREGRIGADWRYMLPTEAQWEYACRAGSTTPYYFGEYEEAALREHARFDRNAFDMGQRFAHRVGRRRPNAWGLCDMHGNVWEWCRDAYVKDLAGGIDPESTDGTGEAVRRGGSWNLSAAYCRSACRLKLEPGLRDLDVGFRLILERATDSGVAGQARSGREESK
jgi:serine/threonine protein kinase